MKIVWQSNAPFIPSGYGQQTALIVPRFRDRLGHEVSISAFYGLDSGKLNWRGIDIFPRGFEAFGNDIAAANAHQFGADILLTHQDAWVQQPKLLQARGMRWVPWMPIDSDPLAPQIAMRIKDAYQAITLSRFGQRMAAQAGLDLPCVVQGIDTNVFTPGSRREARERLGWSQDAFIVGMVAHNRGYPSRKAYPEQLEAFGQFFKRHSDAMIYLHCYGGPEIDKEAPPLLWHLERYGAADAAIWAHPYDLNLGYSVEAMVDRFRAFDVLLSVSMSEGFGIPIIEAQACGTPVITGDWTAMTENTYAGWKVAIEDSEPWAVSPLECFYRLPHIGAIAEQLEAAYSTLQSGERRATLAETGRAAIVANHDQDMLIDTAWRDVLGAIQARIADERVPFHTHTWAPFGHQTTGGIVAPCQIPDCPAEICLNGVQTIYPTGAPLTIDGITLTIEDDPNGGVRHAIAGEITTVYRLDELTFEPGDIVIDIGAHVGVVSCYLAKKWPQIQVYAFEPIAANYRRLLRNIEQNGPTNIVALNYAITADGRPIELSGDSDTNTGHYSAYAAQGTQCETVPSIPLPVFLDQHDITSVALLKLDCEGAEHEILHGMRQTLGLVHAIAMEVHENAQLIAEYGAGAALVEFARINVPWVRASVIPIPDPEGVTT